MIAWIGVMVAFSFFVLWGGGVLQELGRRPQAGAPPQGPQALTPPPDEARAVPDDKRLQVFEDFIRSLPENDSDGPTPPAA